MIYFWRGHRVRYLGRGAHRAIYEHVETGAVGRVAWGTWEREASPYNLEES